VCLVVDQYFGLNLSELGLKLRGCKTRVQWHADSAETADGMNECDKRGTIPEEQCDAIARANV